jgi:hypothetical protein
MRKINIHLSLMQYNVHIRSNYLHVNAHMLEYQIYSIRFLNFRWNVAVVLLSNMCIFQNTVMHNKT